MAPTRPAATDGRQRPPPAPLRCSGRHLSSISLLTCLALAQLVRAASNEPFQFGILQTSSQALSNQQYNMNTNQNNLRTNNNDPLVNHYSAQPLIGANLNYLTQAQQQPLTRIINNNQYQATSDLDNVIESTTTSMQFSAQQQHQHQQQVPPVIPNKFTSQSATCQLPPTWAGRWYQANRESIRVTNTEISDKGVCRDRKGDKYLFEMPSNKQAGRLQSCLVCLVINERHLNVLQYKESSCQPLPASYNTLFSGASNNNNIKRQSNMNDTTLDDASINDDDSSHKLLESVCNEITGDAQLESLFRLDTPSIECPISGKYSFTYDTCHEALSSLDSCIDKKQLNFKYSACPDVHGSESRSEMLKCYADWSEGNNYYMIGRLEQASNQQDKGKFRCFVYEKSPDGKFIQMAQSLEESCYGLINANEGPKTLRLAVKPPSTHKCHFPSYIQSQSESWLSVDNSLIYMFDANSTRYQVKETREGNVIEEATCLQQFVYPPTSGNQHQPFASSIQRGNNNQAAAKRHPSHTYPPPQVDSPLPPATIQTSTSSSRAAATINDIVYLVQITKNCQTTNWCVRFHRRSSGIVQIDYFESSPNSDNQCRQAFLGTPRTQVITSTNLEHQRCPFEGLYSIEAPVENDFTYNPSNIFMCPRDSFITAQCDLASRLRIHYKCLPAKSMTKNLYCLGSWTTDGFVRVLLADDERQRYSAWYRDYTSTPVQDLTSTSTIDNQQLTRSQQLMGLASSNNIIINNAATTFLPIIDLRIALITPLSVASKPMQVRLTRRSQCSDLRNYLATSGSSIAQLSSHHPSNSLSSSLMPSYAPSATGAAAASSSSSATIVISQHPVLSFVLIGSLLTSLIVISFSLTRSAINNCQNNRCNSNLNLPQPQPPHHFHHPSSISSHHQIHQHQVTPPLFSH